MSLVVFGMMFIEPDDYPEQVLDCKTVEEVESINGYGQAVRAVEFLLKQKGEINIKSISSVYTSFFNTNVYFNIEYKDDQGEHNCFIKVKEYVDYSDGGWWGHIATNRTDIDFITAEQYSEATLWWLSNNIDKDTAYDAVERKYNDYAIAIVVEKAKSN